MKNALCLVSLIALSLPLSAGSKSGEKALTLALNSLDGSVNCQIRALSSLAYLVGHNYKPALAAATSVAAKKIIAQDNDVQKKACSLFARLTSKKYAPALETAYKLATSNTSVPIDTKCELLSQLIWAGYKQVYDEALKTALKYSDKRLLHLLVSVDYIPAFLPANTLANKFIDHSDWQQRALALDLFCELTKAKFKPAFEAAKNAAVKSSSDSDWLIRKATLDLFSELVKADYKPAFQEALSAAIKGTFDEHDEPKFTAFDLLRALGKARCSTALEIAMIISRNAVLSNSPHRREWAMQHLEDLAQEKCASALKTIRELVCSKTLREDPTLEKTWLRLYSMLVEASDIHPM